MEMNINSELVRSERLKRAWSQEQLAHVSGLGLRTIQRVETTGGGSLETIKALAAVLELPLSDLLVEAPALVPVPFWRRPINVIASAAATVAVFLFAAMLVPTALAGQVDLNIAIQRNDGTISQPRLTIADGQMADVQIDKQLKIMFKSTIKPGNVVFIEMEVFTWRDGDYQLAAKPALMIENGKSAQMIATTDAGEKLNVSLTPQIQ